LMPTTLEQRCRIAGVQCRKLRQRLSFQRRHA
jgi:hypothetical protein